MSEKLSKAQHTALTALAGPGGMWFRGLMSCFCSPDSDDIVTIAVERRTLDALKRRGLVSCAGYDWNMAAWLTDAGRAALADVDGAK